MKKLILVSFAVLFVAAGCGRVATKVTTDQQKNADGTYTYTAANYGFQIDYPAGWHVSPASGIDGTPSGYQFDSGVDAQKKFYAFIVTRSGASLGDVLDSSLQNTKTNLKNGMEAYEVHGVNDIVFQGDNALVDQRFFIVHNQYVYMLDFQIHRPDIGQSYSADASLAQEDLDIRDRFIQSFKITK